MIVGIKRAPQPSLKSKEAAWPSGQGAGLAIAT